MGGLQTQDVPSLERLKGLDDLPDLQFQLSEAHRSCTHGARADMIAKWLLEKLKSSEGTRLAHEAWQCLLATFRLLTPDRLASLLSTFNFFTTIHLALEDVQVPPTTLNSLVDIIQFLIELSASSQGVPIKATSSLAATLAAPIVGLLLRAATLRTSSPEHSQSSGYDDRLLTTALWLWNHRKASTDDDSLFAKHCLVPVASILSALPVRDVTTNLKRKRSETLERSEQDHVTSLESLVAKHIILPTRTTFIQSQEPPRDPKARATTNGITHPTIDSALEPLKAATVDENWQDGPCLKALPMILDISLRCIATPTVKQRNKERPWNETVFKALHDCNITSSGQLLSNAALIEMLKVTESRTKLSQAILNDLVWSHTNLQRDNVVEGMESTFVDWQMLAQIVELDAELFCQPALSDRVSKALNEDNLAYGNPFPPDQQTTALHNLWLHRVIVPVMKAFAQARNLRAFVDLWAEQLLHDRHTYFWSVWTELDEHFGALLETTITESQIVALFSTLSNDIHERLQGAPSEGSLDPERTFGPSVIILNAMMAGVRTESTLSKLRRGCEELFATLMHFLEAWEAPNPDDTDTIAPTFCIWALLTKVFGIWFPRWMAEQTDHSALVSKGHEWLSSKAIETALSLIQKVHNDELTNKVYSRETHGAENFVACICSALQGVAKTGKEDDLRTKLSGVADRLVQCMDNPQDFHAQALVHLPDTIPLLEPKICQEIFSTGFHKACLSGNYGGGSYYKQALQAMEALGSAAVTYSQIEIIENFVESALSNLQVYHDKAEGSQDREEALMSAEHVAVTALSDFHVDTLSRNQRERILDFLTGSSYSKIAKDTQVQERLGLMIKLMEKPNATCRLSIDSAAIWQLGLGMSALQYTTSRTNSAYRYEQSETLVLLEELVKLVVKHLIATQDQERSRSLIIEMSKNAGRILEYICERRKVADDIAAFTISRSVVAALEAGAKSDLALQFSRSQTLPRTFELLVSYLEENLHKLQLSIVAVEKVSSALLPIAEIVRGTTDADRQWFQDCLQRLRAACLRINEDGCSVIMIDELPSNRKAAIVRCYKLVCNYTTPDESLALTDYAFQLLESRITPDDAALVLDSFRHLLNKIDGSLISHLMGRLLSKSELATQSGLLLLQQCIAKAEKETFDKDNGAIQYRLMPALAQIVTQQSELHVRRRAVTVILTVLKTKPFLNNQHTVEVLLASLPKVLAVQTATSLAYKDVCQIMSALLLHHRARLQGRFHLLIQAFQTLIARLFQKPKASDHGLGLNHTHAHALSRLLTLFCEPPQLRRQPASTELVDASRKEQAHVGQYVQYILHLYCTQVLKGTLGNGMREALAPGLWSIIEAIELSDDDGLKSLSAAMNNSERAILRGVYDDWKKFGQWRGG